MKTKAIQYCIDVLCPHVVDDCRCEAKVELTALTAALKQVEENEMYLRKLLDEAEKAKTNWGEYRWFKKYEKMKEENERLKKQFELDYCLEAEKCKLHGVAMENHALQAENAVLREQNILCIGEVGRLEKENAALRAERDAAEVMLDEADTILSVINPDCEWRKQYVAAKAAKEQADGR